MPAVRTDIDRHLAAFARDHHGVVSAGELTKLGVRGRVRRRLLASGWLRPTTRGVYEVGAGRLTDHGRLRVAALACGESARVTSEGALFLARVTTWIPRRVQIVATARVLAPPEVDVLRCRPLPADECSVAGTIPATTVERALVDMSPRMDPLRLLKHMRAAEYRSVLCLVRLGSVIDRLKHRGTCDNVRRARDWALLGDGGADSALEVRFHALVVGAGFHAPRTNVHVEGLHAHERADFFWPDQGLVVEVDGPHHLEPLVRSDDARRDRGMRAAGRRVIRFWWWQVEECPADVLRQLAAALG